MYSSYKDFTLACASGETGTSYTASATATSIISQVDADAKALGLAKALAVEFIECEFVPTPAAPVYYSVQATASANNQAGYQTHTFTVTLPAASVYSTVSQAAANAAAQTAAQVQANAARDAGQIPIFHNLAQSWTGVCSGSYSNYSVTITVPAGTLTSNVSESDASQAALASAKAQVAALLVIHCITTYLSAVQTYTATCGGGNVGTPVTVSNPVGYSTSTVSQAAANAASLAAATAAANALIVCAAGYVNVQQSFTATCAATYGPNWVGTSKTVTILAGVYFSTVSQADANSQALAAATSQAQSQLVCRWGGGVEP